MFTKKSNAVHTMIMEELKDVKLCLSSFETFLKAACASKIPPAELQFLCSQVCGNEAAADHSLRRMIDSLSGTSLLPSTREELIEIAASCDAVANKCEAFSRKLVYQQFRFPEKYTGALLKIIAITHEQFDLLETSISRLFAKFGEFLRDHSILDQIRDLESQVDEIEQQLYQQMFLLDMDLPHQMQLSAFVESVCSLSDTIEDIADKIQVMLVTRKI